MAPISTSSKSATFLSSCVHVLAAQAPELERAAATLTRHNAWRHENKVDENLTEEERKAAWDEYDQEKKGLIQTNVGMENLQQFGMMLQTMLPKSGDGRIMASPINPMAIQAQLRQMNPELSHEELVSRTRAAIMQLQNMHRCTKISSLKICDFYKSYSGLKPRLL